MTAEQPMTDPDANGAAPEETTAAPAAETVTPSAPGEPDAAQALAREAAETKDRLLRTLAEMENLRRRTEREVADARSYGIAAFARDLLGVSDNIRRALASIDGAARENADSTVKAFIEGVELTERELLRALDKHGVKKFDPTGEKFDPNVHQAMYEVPDPSVPVGTVVQVMQPGYMIGERVLRPALVGVAKGGPKPGAEPPANDNPAEQTEPQGSQ
jgi:molecular chaperone GrpE